MTQPRRAAAVHATVVSVLLVSHFLLRPLFVASFASPNLLVGGLLLATLRLRAGHAALLGFGLGTLEAAMALEGIAQIPLVLALVGYLGARSRDLLFADARFFTLAYLFVGTWVAEVGMLILTVGRLDPVYIFVQSPLDAFLTALVCGAVEAAVSSILS